MAPISTNLILSLPRRARARPAAVLLMNGALPLKGITVVAIEQAVAAPFCTASSPMRVPRVIKSNAPRATSPEATTTSCIARAAISFG